MKHKEIKSYSRLSKNSPWVDTICCMVCPFFTNLFINKKLRPNTVTLFMIIFGVLGSLCMALPNVYFKTMAFVMYFMWYVMDCSDGQVARITKQFSSYGVEMDYMAHLITHSTFLIAVWCCFYQYGYDIVISSVSVLSAMAMELIYRSLVAFDYYRNNKRTMLKSSFKQSVFKYIFSQLVYFPNIIIIYSLIIAIRQYVVFDCLMIFLSVEILIFLYFLKSYIGRLLIFYKN